VPLGAMPSNNRRHAAKIGHQQTKRLGHRFGQAS
jgi:hypothetical protein